MDSVGKSTQAQTGNFEAVQAAHARSQAFLDARSEAVDQTPFMRELEARPPTRHEDRAKR